MSDIRMLEAKIAGLEAALLDQVKRHAQSEVGIEGRIQNHLQERLRQMVGRVESAMTGQMDKLEDAVGGDLTQMEGAMADLVAKVGALQREAYKDLPKWVQAVEGRINKLSNRIYLAEESLKAMGNGVADHDLRIVSLENE